MDILKRPNFIDWAIYRLFMWTWNPILKTHPRLLAGFLDYMQEIQKRNGLILPKEEQDKIQSITQKNFNAK